jgi:hypothetical protein
MGLKYCAMSLDCEIWVVGEWLYLTQSVFSALLDDNVFVVTSPFHKEMQISHLKVKGTIL